MNSTTSIMRTTQTKQATPRTDLVAAGTISEYYQQKGKDESLIQRVNTPIKQEEGIKLAREQYSFVNAPMVCTIKGHVKEATIFPSYSNRPTGTVVFPDLISRTEFENISEMVHEAMASKLGVDKSEVMIRGMDQATASFRFAPNKCINTKTGDCISQKQYGTKDFPFQSKLHDFSFIGVLSGSIVKGTSNGSECYYVSFAFVIDRAEVSKIEYDRLIVA